MFQIYIVQRLRHIPSCLLVFFIILTFWLVLSKPEAVLSIVEEPLTLSKGLTVYPRFILYVIYRCIFTPRSSIQIFFVFFFFGTSISFFCEAITLLANFRFAFFRWFFIVFFRLLLLFIFLMLTFPNFISQLMSTIQ